MEAETITIPKLEYERLLADSTWLHCLQDAGVDNWQGYDFACELAQERETNGTNPSTE